MVDNSRLEGGAVATVIISAANSFIFRDATLIQKPTASTYDSNKTLMGLSVLYLCDADGNATPTTLEGSFVQYAWADESCSAYLPEGTESIMTAVLAKNDYVHTVNEKNCVNLGFAYMPNDGSTVSEPANILDNRTNAGSVPYAYESVSAKVSLVTVSTYVYTYKNTNGNEFATESQYESNKYSDIISVSYSDSTEGLTFGKSYGTNGWIYEMNVDLDTASGYALDFSKMSMSVNGVTVTDFKVDGADKPTSPVAVVAGGTTYTLTATVNGEEYTTTYKVTGTETSKNAPQLIDAVDGNQIDEGSVAWGAGKCVTRKDDRGDTNYSGAAPVLEGIVIRYWSVANGEYIDLQLTDITPANSTALNGTNNYWEYAATNGDYTLKITNTAHVHDGNDIYAMPVAYKGTMYFVPSSEKGFVSTKSGDRSFAMEYEFKDNNGGKLIFNHTWSIGYNSSDSLSYKDMTGIADGCVAAGSLITLADGSQVKVEDLTGTEELLVWNLETGSYDSAPIVFVDSDAEAEYEIVHLYFADGTDVEVIYEHGFFDADLGKYVYLDANNAADYIGHSFIKQGDIANGTWETVELTEVVIENKVTTAYSPVTFSHLCYYVDGMLSMPGGIDGLFNIFEVDTDTMAYDAEKKAQDIETYGLYTYEDFADLIPEEAFYAFNGAYLKVAIAKGLLTWEDIVYLAERYVPLM